MNIYISNLSFSIQEKDLNRIFAQYGEVASVKIVLDKETNRSRGFAFVMMTDHDASKNAISELDGSTIDGRTVKVTEATNRWEAPAERAEINYNNSSSYNQNQY